MIYKDRKFIFPKFQFVSSYIFYFIFLCHHLPFELFFVFPFLSTDSIICSYVQPEYKF